jgi:multicomponent Na+:H+ antiporter subunit B
MLAYGKEEAFKRLSKKTASFFESFGALMFLAIAVLGFIGGYFFLNFVNKGDPFKLFSSGMIPLCNIAICFKVGAGLFAIFVALTLLKLDWPEKK